jgi:hypothetical protein
MCRLPMFEGYKELDEGLNTRLMLLQGITVLRSNSLTVKILLPEVVQKAALFWRSKIG